MIATDWVGLSAFIVSIATLVPVLVTAWLQIKQNPKVNETHAAVAPVNGEPPIVQQVSETNANVKSIASELNNGGTK